MYFYIHKINKNEQKILLEMCNNAGFYFGNGRGSYGLIYMRIFNLKVAGQRGSATFLFYNVTQL